MNFFVESKLRTFLSHSDVRKAMMMTMIVHQNVPISILPDGFSPKGVGGRESRISFTARVPKDGKFKISPQSHFLRRILKVASCAHP